MRRTDVISKASAQSEIYDDVITNGIIGPDRKMLGPVADGGKITFLTAPGCWGGDNNSDNPGWSRSMHARGC
jgi:hypothetical protein